MNYRAIGAIYKFEMARTWRTLLQSIVSPVVSTSTAPVKVGSPDSSDMEQQEALPEDAGK